MLSLLASTLNEAIATALGWRAKFLERWLRNLLVPQALASAQFVMALDMTVMNTANLAGGVPFISDADLEAALADVHVPRRSADEIVQTNEQRRIDGLRVAVSILALFALASLLFTRGIPTVQPGAQPLPTSGWRWV